MAVSRSELEAPLSNMNALVSLAADLFIDHLECPRHGSHHLLPANIGNQIASLLIAARDYGEAEYKKHNGGAA